MLYILMYDKLFSWQHYIIWFKKAQVRTDSYTFQLTLVDRICVVLTWGKNERFELDPVKVRFVLTLFIFIRTSNFWLRLNVLKSLRVLASNVLKTFMNIIVSFGSVVAIPFVQTNRNCPSNS